MTCSEGLFMRRLFWFALVASSLNAAVMAGEPREKVKPIVVWTGTDSGQTTASVARCMSKEQWRATWKAHQNEGGDDGRAPPEVDFDGHMILAIFRGTGSQNYGLFDFEVLDESDCLRVRYITGYYQTGGLPDSEAERRKLDTQSYAFLVLPKTSKAIVFEEAKNIRTRSGWVERGRIAADERK
jgi:hypothetical protein